MDEIKSNQLTDDELIATWAEAHKWTVDGTQGHALCIAASLQHAIHRAQEYAQAGATVAAITRLGSSPVHVFPSQMERIAAAIIV